MNPVSELAQIFFCSLIRSDSDRHFSSDMCRYQVQKEK